MKELAAELGISSRDYSSFRNQVKNLIDSGQLVKLRRGRIGVPSEMNLAVGIISINKGGFGTMMTEAGEPLVVPPSSLATALDGDRVMVRVDPGEDDESYGKVIKILDRSERNIVGRFSRGKHFSMVLPDDKKVRRDVYVPNRLSKNAADGQRVVARINSWDDPHRNPEGEIIEILGHPDEPGVDMLTVIKTYNLPEEFPDPVVREAKACGELFNRAEMNRRRSFTRETVFTIDPVDAKDFDDAVSVVKTKKGYRLGVYIADVSHFVKEDTELDSEAFNRGTSVYLPGQVIPMLPEHLSNELCSLKPNRRRLVYAILMDISPKGDLLDWEITEGVINSRARLTYEEVQEFFENGAKSKKLARVADSLLLARKLAEILHRKRMAGGSLDFDLPEAKVVMDKKGRVIELGKRIRLESHRLVEEFMLVANQSIALHVFRAGQKFLYRVHDKPDMEKLEAFSYLMSTLGHSFPVSPHMKTLQFSRFLQKVRGKPEEEFINELLLRSMKKAVYQMRNIGHFGLAFKHYTHFTSPIRRYPDLMVHRLLKKLKNGRYPVSLNKRLDSILTHVGNHCSDAERNAEAAERDAIRIKQVSYMAHRLGDEYSGVISGILNFGFFVRLPETGVEGMVRLSTLDDDYYKFDEKRFRLVGRSHGRVFQMGDEVRVGILSVDKIKNEINLYLVDNSETKKSPKKKRKKRRRR